MYFPFALFEAEGTDPSWLGHLASKRVWDEMYKFVPPIDICIAELNVNFCRALNECLNHLKLSKPSAETIGETYQGLAKTLFTMAALPPLSFETQILEMMQRAKHVRRPFSGRSSVLVFTWSHVATNSNILQERGIARRQALRKCVNGMRLRVLLFSS